MEIDWNGTIMLGGLILTSMIGILLIISIVGTWINSRKIVRLLKNK